MQRITTPSLRDKPVEHTRLLDEPLDRPTDRPMQRSKMVMTTDVFAAAPHYGPLGIAREGGVGVRAGDSSQTAGEAPRLPQKKRVITAARKEQNRKAQQLFRQKKKEQRAANKAHDNSNSIPKEPARQLPVLRPKPGSGPAGRHDALCGSSAGALPDTSTMLDESSDLSLIGINLPLPVKDMGTGLYSTPHETVQDSDSIPDTDWNESWSSASTGDLVPSPASAPCSSSSSSSDARECLPDPFANSLEFTPTIIFSACLHNAMALGFDLGDLANCAADLMSPFYRPVTPSDDPASLLSSSVLSLGTAGDGGAMTLMRLPPDLRPTLNQVLIPHHASLDLIPFPALRDRAIVLSAMMPQTFNMWELKLDIYERGGLTVAKGSEGKNGPSIRRRREEVEERWTGLDGSLVQAGRCQPWDRKSWVAKPWFLKKWRVIVGDEKDLFDKESPRTLSMAL